MDSPGRLPVFDTLGKAIRYTLTNIVVMIQVSWLWVAILLAATAIVVLQPAPDLPGSADWLWAVVLVVLYLVAMYAIAVAWHRRLLLGEQPGWFTVSLGWRELGYLGYVVAITAISGSGIGLGMLASLATGIAPAPAIAAGGFVMILILGRLHLVLPGSAVSDRRMSLAQSFRLTAGNTWRIAGGFLLIALLNGGVNLLSSGLDPDTDAVSAVGVGLAMVGVAGSVLMAFITLSYMSFCYWFFVPPPADGDLA